MNFQKIFNQLPETEASAPGRVSLRDDYEISVPALDMLIEILQKTPGVFGARLTGAGFGGATVAMVAAGEGINIAATVLKEYSKTGNTGQTLVPTGGM